jgi:hypothetical protein
VKNVTGKGRNQKRKKERKEGRGRKKGDIDEPVGNNS